MKIIQLQLGDNIDLMKKLPDNSIGSIATDPPYGLGFMSKKWDKPWEEAEDGENDENEDGAPPKTIAEKRAFQTWAVVWLKECHRILRPGGVIKVFSGTRTYHRIAAAMEESGFKLLRLEAWCYGCLTEDAEILTETGWKLGTCVQVGDIVACWDPKTEGTIYAPVEKVTKAPVKGSIVRLCSADTDQILTLNHRVYLRGNSDEWVVSRAEELLGKYVEVPLEDGKTTKAFGELVEYDGMVWCVQVPTGAFFARRAGKVFITGNSGFPKSLDVSKALDRSAGAEREVLGIRKGRTKSDSGCYNWNNPEDESDRGTVPITEPVTDLAKRYRGFGTCLKPAFEPFVVGVKPINVYVPEITTDFLEITQPMKFYPNPDKQGETL